MLDEVVNAGYPYYYLFDDVNEDADGGMNKDGETFCSNRIESCLLCYPTPPLPFHLHSLSHSFIITSTSTFLGGDFGYTHKEILYWTMPERTPYTYDTMMNQYTGYGAPEKTEADGEQQEQNAKDEEEVQAELDLDNAENQNGDGFSTKKFSVVLGAITFMWYYLSMVMWW